MLTIKKQCFAVISGRAVPELLRYVTHVLQVNPQLNRLFAHFLATTTSKSFRIPCNCFYYKNLNLLLLGTQHVQQGIKCEIPQCSRTEDFKFGEHYCFAIQYLM